VTDRLTADPDPDPDPATKLNKLRNPGTHPSNLYGTIRHWLPLFASVGVLSVLTGLIPFPYARTGEVVIAAVLFLALTVTAMLLPWPRVPQWFWPVIPVGYIGVVALLRDAQGGGGGEAGLSALYFLPVVWLALYGKRSHLVVGLVAMAAALVVPIVVIGSPAYPSGEWRGVLVNTAVATLISFSFLTMVTRDRKYVADMAQQTLLVQQGARQAIEAREQLDSLLRAATETSIIGADGNGLVTFFSAGAQQMLGYTADEVVGKLTLSEFVDRDKGSGQWQSCGIRWRHRLDLDLHPP
jgi:PAS domain-containing protein